MQHDVSKITRIVGDALESYPDTLNPISLWFQRLDEHEKTGSLAERPDMLELRCLLAKEFSNIDSLTYKELLLVERAATLIGISHCVQTEGLSAQLRDAISQFEQD